VSMDLPGLGAVTEDEDWLVTGPRKVPALGGRCRFLIDGHDPEVRDALVACLDAFCRLEPADLEVASAHVFAYYSDVAAEVGPEPGFPRIEDAAEVWGQVRLTAEPVVQHDGTHWYVVLENECSWEPEHGLMIVLREGRQVTKVGQYGGHLTNRQAFTDDSIPEDAVYWSPSPSR